MRKFVFPAFVLKIKQGWLECSRWNIPLLGVKEVVYEFMSLMNDSLRECKKARGDKIAVLLFLVSSYYAGSTIPCGVES